MLLVFLSYVIDSKIINQVFKYNYSDNQYIEHYIDIIVNKIKFDNNILNVTKSYIDTNNITNINNLVNIDNNYISDNESDISF